MQWFRRHLSYANIVATLALVVATAGGAYAVNKVGTRDVKNNSLRSADLKNRTAVAGRDVRRNSLGAAEVKEARLDPSPLFRMTGDDRLSCDPTEDSFAECATTDVALKRPMNLQVVASGAFSSRSGSAAQSACFIRIDGQDAIVQLNPGEEIAANTSQAATDGFAATYVTDEPLVRGSHEVALSCTQIGSADAVIEDPSIAVIAVAAP